MTTNARKTVLITGCSTGSIGSALALEYHRQSHHVFACARQLSKMQHLADAGIETLVLDVTSSADISAAASHVSAATNGSLDVLVNNAGQTHVSMLADQDMDSLKKIYDVNVFSIVALTQAFLPLLLASKGTVVNHVGSLTTLLDLPGRGAYGSSKHAASALSNVLRLELSPFEVSVVLLTTGVVSSEILGENWPACKVREASIYYPAKDQIEGFFNGDSWLKSGMMTPEEYAKNVVGKLEGMRGSGYVYDGAKIQFGRWAGWLFPWWFRDAIVLKKIGISRIERGKDQ